MDDCVQVDSEARPVGELTGRQRAFVAAYTGPAWLNGTRAAQIAGYGQGENEDVWAQSASRLLRNVKVRAEIDRRLAAVGLGPSEVLAILARQAKGDVADLVRDDNILMLDPAKVREHGYLINKLKWTKAGVEVELYSAQEAVELAGKALGMFQARIDVTTAGESLNANRLPEEARDRALAALFETVREIVSGNDHPGHSPADSALDTAECAAMAGAAEPGG